VTVAGRRQVLASGLVVWAMVVAGVAAGDQVHMAEGQQSYMYVTVTGLSEGMLEFRSRSHGNVVRKPLRQIKLIQLDDVPDFNRGEGEFSRGRYSEAIEQFELARRRVRSGWLADLIDVRLLEAYEAAGRFDRAVATFVQLLPRVPSEAASRRPKRAGQRGSQYNRLALEQVERALERTKAPNLVRELKLLKLEILYAEQDASADELAAELGAEHLRTAGGRRGRGPTALRSIERLVSHGQYERALRAISSAIGSAGDEQLDGLLLLRARCQLAMARTAEQMKVAALTAMRVVIHFPDSPLVGEALFLVGLVHERLGISDQAVELYGQCRARPEVNGATATRAAEAVARLSGHERPVAEQQR
jgi:tetratricopeptide (TPR) repeat protein